MKRVAVKSKKSPAKVSHVGRNKDRGERSKPGVTTPLSHEQIARLRESFARIAPQSGIAAMIFYRNLFTLDPSLRSLFHTTIELQGRKFMDSLEYTVASLENPRALIPVLEAMGRRHVTYGTKPGHYATVVKALLQTLDECLEKEFKPEVKTAWRRALEFVTDTMQRSAAQVHALTESE